MILTKNLRAHLFLLSANIIYGINYSVAKDIMPGFIQPSGFVLIRVLGGLIIFLICAKVLIKETIDKTDLPRFFLCGFFGVALNQIMFFEGLSRTSPINASIIMVITPIMVLVMASLILREKITGSKISGIALGLSGALLLLLGKGTISFSSESMLGDLFILINACSYAVYLVLAKPLMYKYNALTVMKMAFLFGLPLIIPFGLSQALEVQWHTFTTIIWMEVLFVIVFTTFLAYVLNTIALKQVSSTVVSIYIYLQPLLAAGIALLLNKDELSAIKIISAVLIFAGVYLVSRTPRVNA